MPRGEDPPCRAEIVDDVEPALERVRSHVDDVEHMSVRVHDVGARLQQNRLQHLVLRRGLVVGHVADVRVVQVDAQCACHRPHGSASA